MNLGANEVGLQPPSFSPIADKLHFKAMQVAFNATPESLAAMSDDDPLLKIIYCEHGLNNLEEGPYHNALVADMKRRGEVTVDILVECFKNPYYRDMRGHILHGLLYVRSWLKPDRFLPLARAWHTQTKAWNEDDTFRLVRFLSWAGQPEDEALMRKLTEPDGEINADMKNFLRRIEAIKKYREAEKQKKDQVADAGSQPVLSAPLSDPVGLGKEKTSFVHVPWVVGGGFLAVAALCAWMVCRKKKADRNDNL